MTRTVQCWVRPARRPWRRRASGFTLIELVLALAVMSTLLVALYGAFDIYARLSTAGREGVQRARLARAILRKLQTDLHSIVYQPDDPSSGAAGAATAPASSAQTTGTTSSVPSISPVAGLAMPAGSTTSSATTTLSSLAVSSTHQGLMGDPTTLMIYVSRPRNPVEQINAPVPGTQGQLQSVSWFLAAANGGGLQGAVGNLAAGGNIYTSRETGSQGLTRLAGDPFVLSQADAQDDLQTMANYAEVLADEVNLLQFRYFDGAQWLDTWDSSAMGGLPRAVEITLGFRPPDNGRQQTTNPVATLGIEPVSSVYRLVVALPMAPPQAATATATSPY